MLNLCHKEDSEGMTHANVLDMVYEWMLQKLRSDLQDQFVQKQEFTPFKSLVDRMKEEANAFKKEINDAKETTTQFNAKLKE